MNAAALGAGLAILLSSVGAIPAPAQELDSVPRRPTSSPAGGWSASFGPRGALALDDTIREIYGSAPHPGFGGGLRYAWSPRFRAQVMLDWHRTEDALDPGLAASAEGSLTLLPFVTEFQFRPLRARIAAHDVGLWIGVGPAVVFKRDTIAYTLFDETTTLRGRRSDVGGSGSLESEIAFGRLSISATGRIVLTGGHREILRPTGRSDEGKARSTPTHVSLGLGLSYRF